MRKNRSADGVGGDATDDERHDREVQHLAVVGEHRQDVRMVADAGHGTVGLGAGQAEQQREEHRGSGGEAHLASEREPEPEPGAVVLEQLAEVELVAQARYRVEDPQRPNRQHEREEPLLPRA